MLGIFAALAEYDRERAAGTALAKAQDKHLGFGQSRADLAKVAKVKAWLDVGMSVHQVVAATGVSETSVKRYRRQLVG